ncbi:MAG: SDR family NAD(P)-dependent oxidoreductase [Dehalococcoidia bacterium]
MKLKDRVALITGASRGIGTAIAKRMAREGAAVVVNYFRSEKAALQVVKDIENSGGRAIAIRADVGDYQQVKNMMEQATGELGKVDILVSNAGIGGLRKPIIDTTPEEFFEMITNHLIGAYNCAHNVLPYMRQYERGDIQFISSRNAEFCGPETGAYNAAKGGIDALAKSLAKEERYNGIRVNAIAPGMVETDMTREGIAEVTGIQDMRRVDPGLPFGRLIQPEDIGNLCAFLASPEGSHISGEVIYVRQAVGNEPPSFYLSGPRNYY